MGLAIIGGSARKFASVAEEAMQYAHMKPDELTKKTRKLDQQMFKHARDLEFEEAANLHEKNLSYAGTGYGADGTGRRARLSAR